MLYKVGAEAPNCSKNKIPMRQRREKLEFPKGMNTNEKKNHLALLADKQAPQ